MTMPQLYSEDSEDSVLRNFLDEQIAQHVQTSSPILEMAEENGFMANPNMRNGSPSQRSRTSHSRQNSRQTVTEHDFMLDPADRTRSHDSPSRRSRTSHSRQQTQETDESRFTSDPISRSQRFDSPGHGSRTSHSRQQSRTTDGNDFMADPAPRNQSHDSPSRRSRTSHTQQHARQASSSSKSSKDPDELVQRLIEQTREANTLRRALQLAVDRMHSNADEAALSERSRVQAQTAEYFHRLNESRITAQQEALQASADLRVYQLELESAREDARRARDMLALVEQERHSAVSAAKEAREQTRELHRRYMADYSFHSGRDDAMRAGIEEGLLRERLRMLGREVREDAGYYGHGTPPEFRSEGRPLQPIQPMEAGPSQYTQTRPEFNGFRAAFSEPNIAGHPYQDEHAPNIQVVSPSGAPIEQPVPITFPHPEPAPPPDPRAPSPAVQVYEIEIPSSAVLERQYSTRSADPVRKSKGPWLTAEEHMALRNIGHQGQQPPPQQPEIQEEEEIGDVTFIEVPSPEPQPPPKPKESWYRSLRRKLTGKSKPKQETLAPYGAYSRYSSRPEPEEPPPPPQPQSWYSHKLGPHVQSTGVGVPMQPSSSTGSAYGAPPIAASNTSQRSGPARSYRTRAESLSIIQEDPRNGMTPGMKSVKSGRPHLRSVSMDIDQTSVHPSIGQSGYAQPSAMENWRSSTATGTSSQMPTMRGSKKPVNLSVPAPLALDVPGSVPPGALESTYMDSSGLLKPPGRSPRSSAGSDPVGPPQPSAPVNIDVQSPSNSPSEVTRSAPPDESFGFLSPNTTQVPLYQPSIRSVTGSRRGQPAPQSQESDAAPVARPPSRSAHLASPTPSRGAGRSLVDSPQGPPNLLGLTAPNDPSKPPVPRKSPRHSESNLQTDEPFRPSSRFSQRSRGTARASPPEHRAPSVSGHMRTASDPQWGAKTPSLRSRQTNASGDQGQGHGTPAASLRERTLIRVPSSNSENGKSLYGRFTSDSYVDPAFFSVDPNAPPPQPARMGTPSMRSHRSRAPSSASGLSYFDDPRITSGH